MEKDEKTNLTDVEVSETPETEEISENDASSNSKSKQLPPNVEVIKGRNWLPYVITAAVLAVLTVLAAWVRGAFSEVNPQTLASLKVTELQYRMQQWCDAFSVPGIMCLCFGGLMLASNGGAFDMIAYGIKRFFGLFKKDPLDRKYGGYYEYKQAKSQKKRQFWYFIVVGGAYLLVGVILLILYHTV